jgi:predicted nucleotidyltransferase
MIFNTTSMKIMQYFFENPYEQIHLRGLSRKAKTSIYSTKIIVDDLVKQNILIENRHGNQRSIRPNMDNRFYLQLKIAFSIKKIQDSKLIKFLEDKIPAISSITLYGSTAEGKDDNKSDIDLLIIGQKIKADISTYEKKINKEINLLIMKWSEWRTHASQDKPFYREIVKNGIALYGDIPVIE